MRNIDLLHNRQCFPHKCACPHTEYFGDDLMMLRNRMISLTEDEEQVIWNITRCILYSTSAD